MSYIYFFLFLFISLFYKAIYWISCSFSFSKWHALSMEPSSTIYTQHKTLEPPFFSIEKKGSHLLHKVEKKELVGKKNKWNGFQLFEICRVIQLSRYTFPFFNFHFLRCSSNYKTFLTRNFSRKPILCLYWRF